MVAIIQGPGWRVSSVALFELRFGAALSNRQRENAGIIDAMLADGIEVVPFEAEDAREASEVRAWARKAAGDIGPHDVLVAGQARRHRATLVMHNSPVCRV